VIGGLPGIAVCRALTIAARASRESRDATAFDGAVTTFASWTIAPAARAGAFLLALAAGGRAAAWRAVGAPATRPTAPAEATLLAALGEPQREDPAYLRRAIALYRRAAAAEFCALAALTLVTALAI